MQDKKQMTIGVFFGSRNPEHEVSIITAQLVISELKKLNYRVIPVYLDKTGRWFSDEKLGELKFFTNSDFELELKKMQTYSLGIAAEQKKLMLANKSMFAKKQVIDLAFPAFHGMNGEDGTVQGLFELANLPYVGCDVAASSMTMDKIITKQMYQAAQIPTTNFINFTAHDWQQNKQAILENIQQLSWPLFVKPARLGSSIGITKVQNLPELENACEVALHYDNRIIVEEGVENLMDITCAVIGNNDPKASLVQEAIFGGEHFSYEDKYLENGGAQLGNAKNNIIIPARIDENTTKQVQELSLKIYKLFACSGIARIDFLYDSKNHKLFANEINTLPGTLYHHLWKASGIEVSELIEKLIDLALEKHQEKNNITSTFKSDILSFANSVKLQMKKE